MRIPSLLVVTTLLMSPGAASSQVVAMDWGPTFRLTPFIAISPAFTQVGEATIVGNNGGVTVRDVQSQFQSGFGMGLNAELRVWNAVTIVGSGMYSSRADGAIFDVQDSTFFEMDGTNFWLFKGALALQLHDLDQDMNLYNVNASLYAGPAIVVDDPKSERTTSGAARSSSTHTAWNMGAEAELPFWDNQFAFRIAAEDYLIFWDNDAVQGRVGEALQNAFPGANITAAGKSTHMWMFRFGVTFHF